MPFATFDPLKRLFNFDLATEADVGNYYVDVTAVESTTSDTLTVTFMLKVE